MKRPSQKSCPGCRRLEAIVEALRAEVASLREQLAAAQKNSSTSSKPPSSDIVKPKPSQADDSVKRSIGGQPGHPKHEREAFSAEQVTHFETHILESCPCCGGPIHLNGDKAKVVQQVDITRPPQTIEQHTSPEFWCKRCNRGFQAPMPAYIERGGLTGPQLTALIAFMKGACHASFSTTRTFLRDVVGVTISRGQLSKILGKVSEALAKPYEELLASFACSEVLRVGLSGPDTKHGQNMVKRFREHGEAYFTFIAQSGIEPTNNLAEQAIRFVVIDRHITQGTRSEAGRRFCERMWTTIATCVQQGRSVWHYLCEAVGNWFAGRPAPSLLPAGS